MRSNHVYLLWVWLLASFFIAFMCAIYPEVRTSPITYLPQTFFFRLGIFFGVLAFQIRYSLAIFVCLYGIFYLLTRKFYLSEFSVRLILILFFLLGVFISNKINFPWTWLHDYSFSYTLSGIGAFLMIDMLFDPVLIKEGKYN